MARRMFSPVIVDSDAFLDMPVSSQALYFHLGMHADDDGFVNPKRLMRAIGVSDDDLKVLVGKRFVLPFDNGVVVIKHWRINNLIRKDWYKETMYLEQKNTLKIKGNGAYTELGNSSLTKPLTVRPRRLGKVRLGKVIRPASQDDAGIPEIIDLFKEVNPSYQRLFGMPPQRNATARLLATHGKDKLTSMIAYLPKSNASKYAPTITTPAQFEAKLGELIAWSQKQKDIKQTKVV